MLRRASPAHADGPTGWGLCMAPFVIQKRGEAEMPPDYGAITDFEDLYTNFKRKELCYQFQIAKYR
jgi:hypothetical protein